MDDTNEQVPFWLGIERAVNEWRASAPLSILPDSCGSQVLAMPEMQAIREALLLLHLDWDLDLDLPERGVTLPPAVLRWVFGPDKELVDRE